MTRLSDTGLRNMARKCYPKEQHASRGAAESHIRGLVKLGKERDANTLRPYKCVHCGQYHVGHAKHV